MLPFLLEHRFVEEKDSFGHGPNNESFQQSNLKLGALKLGLKKRGVCQGPFWWSNGSAFSFPSTLVFSAVLVMVLHGRCCPFCSLTLHSDL